MLLTYFLQNGILRLIISIPLNTVYFVELSILRICCGTLSVSNNTFFILRLTPLCINITALLLPSEQRFRGSLCFKSAWPSLSSF